MSSPEQKESPEPKPSKELLDAIQRLMPVDEYNHEYYSAVVEEEEVSKKISRAYWKSFGTGQAKPTDHELVERLDNAQARKTKVKEAQQKAEQKIYEMGAREGLSQSRIRNLIDKRNPRQTPCLGGCGKFRISSI
jgi:predicted TPR repeat methyltransferase